jgi:hypothetical protein
LLKYVQFLGAHLFFVQGSDQLIHFPVGSFGACRHELAQYVSLCGQV